jgi:hypothetical protein
LERNQSSAGAVAWAATPWAYANAQRLKYLLEARDKGGSIVARANLETLRVL